MEDHRLLKISNLLANYSQANFDVEEIELSENLDEIDTIISSVNMLGEELKSATISRDFFSSIYNAVTDMLFVIDKNGKIQDTNNTTLSKLGRSIKSKGFFDICNSPELLNEFKNLKLSITKNHEPLVFETYFTDIDGNFIYTQCTASAISNSHSGSYLIIAEDITLKKESEKRIFRAVLETQEKERKRVSDDLHDSIGQELSSIKMMLGVVKKTIDNQNQKNIINSTVDILENSIQDLRNICFNLMPSVLDKGGLIYAIQQLIEKINLNINFNSNVEEIALDNATQVSLYRVIQEFINNTIKHAEAQKIEINIQQTKHKLIISISDDGKGFNMKTLPLHDGRGLNTMKSRVETFGGNYVFLSKVGVGSKLKIIFE